ncbi:7603_t:CDS:2 [Ambispora gerdemannii]|uniref:Cytochrome c oxidase subunit n=1 Tax=Ambispora gerdemannii TaxID=144530 RepID=A0A9N8V714_9GLOM|nr:7603_t:CDS:2 [Ambispora gerdemannii]
MANFLTPRFSSTLAATRASSFRRGLATVANSEGTVPFVAQRQAIKEHAAATTRLWKNITIYVCVPSLILATWNAYRIMKEHEKHEAHHHVSPEERPLYPYMRLRNKPFPWGDGDHTLFHNPKQIIEERTTMNKLM